MEAFRRPRLSFAAVMPSSTIRPGTRARQGLWQNPPYYAESDSFAFGGACTFATSACATKYGQTPSAISVSDGFPIFTSPPNPADFTGTFIAQNTNFKLGRIQQFNVNVEHQLPATSC